MIFHKKKKRNNISQPTPQRITAKDNQKVFSYYTATRKQLDDIQRKSNNKLDNKFSKSNNGPKVLLFRLFIILSLIAMGVYLSILQSTAHIQINGPKYRNDKQYQKIVSNLLSQDVRNRTKFLLNAYNLQESIYKELPEALSVKVFSSLLGHRPEVKIYTANPLAIFTQNDNQEKFIISTHGKLLMALQDTSYDYLKLPVLQNNTGFLAGKGTQFIRPSEASEIKLLIDQLSKDISQYTIRLSTQPHEIELLETGRGYYTKMILVNNNILEQYGAMRAVQDNIKQNRTPSPNEYLDVRLSDKVYIK